MLKFSFGLLNLKKKIVDELYLFCSRKFSDVFIDMCVLKVGKCVNFIMYYYC